MNPDKTLENIRAIVDDLFREPLIGNTLDLAEELCECVRALDEWLIGGGRVPSAWSSPCRGWPSQNEIRAWLRRPGRTVPSVLVQALKLAEEAGEVCGAVVKRERPYHLAPPGGWSAHIRSEIADVVIAAMTMAEIERFDLATAVARKWALVQLKYAAIDSKGHKEETAR